MHTIKNLVNSPYDIRCQGGTVERLPARGEITVDIDQMHLPLYRALGYFVITEAAHKTEAEPVVDEETDAIETEAEPVDEDKAFLDKLRAEYTELVGKKPYGGWKADELQARIDKALET